MLEPKPTGNPEPLANPPDKPTGTTTSTTGTLIKDLAEKGVPPAKAIKIATELGQQADGTDRPAEKDD